MCFVDHVEPRVPATGYENTAQYRQGVDLPTVISSSPTRLGAVEEPQVPHYWEIADNDQVPAVEAVADTEVKRPYDHLGRVQQQPGLPPVYLELAAENAVEAARCSLNVGFMRSENW